MEISMEVPQKAKNMVDHILGIYLKEYNIHTIEISTYTCFSEAIFKIVKL
jgi:acid stress-induced BolA-like protein IbaG/YrbA